MESNFFLPGTASLVQDLDKKILVALRDGRKLVGVLRSFDHYANIVLENTTERLFVGNVYGDIPLGLFVVRGDNIVLIGDMDADKERDQPLRKVTVEEILKLYTASKSEAPQERDEILRSIRNDNAIFEIGE